VTAGASTVSVMALSYPRAGSISCEGDFVPTAIASCG
jgi:hypothetical protein